MKTFVAEYLSANQNLLASLDSAQIAKVIEKVKQTGDAGKNIYAIGNGGSSSTASHFVNDMCKGASIGRKKRFRMIPLTDNVAWMTALSNDLCYDDVFVEQIRNFAEQGDLLIAISGSGNSENVLRAVNYANEIGCYTIGFIGFGGGKLRSLVNHCIIVNSNHMGRIEDMHMVLQHIICYYFMESE